jgi:two-component system, cell cycle response regulator
MRQSVLVIDDSVDTHELIRATLAGDGVDILEASDGESGIATVTSKLPDLILLDIHLPGADGFEICRRLKSDPVTTGIPIIFLSIASTTREKTRGLELGAIDYITKPFEPAELRARVHSGLRTKFLLDLLSQRAKVDGLTGLWNRPFFEERLEAELSLSRRSGRPIACVLLDVDHFKHINDKYGHTAGDLVLRTLGQTLRANCRTEDVVCRWGGEEFVALCPNTDASAAVVAAERLRVVVESLAPQCLGTTIPVTCSIGVSDTVSCGSATLVEAADKCLYEAKNNGRNQVRSTVGSADLISK